MIGKIFMIGAGAAGGSLAVALTKAGCEVAGVYDPIRERASTIAEAANARHYWEEPPGEIRDSNIVFLAVPDSRISKTAEDIARLGLNTPSQIWLHISGAHPAEILAPLSKAGASIGSFHPALVFPPERITEIPSGACFAIDGDESAVGLTNEMAEKLGGSTVRVSAAARPVYHAATVLASNYVAALLWQAREMMLGSGIESADIERLLTFLASSALNRAKENGIDKSLSGPIRRGDVETVKCHLTALKEQPEALELYRVMGKAALRLTESIGETDINSLDSIKKLLKG